MSFILDALKKAEQERGTGPPLLRRSVARPLADPRARPWMWGIVAALVLNAAVMLFVLRGSREPAEPQAPKTAPVAAPASSSSPPELPRRAATAARPAPAPIVARASEADPGGAGSRPRGVSRVPASHPERRPETVRTGADTPSPATSRAATSGPDAGRAHAERVAAARSSTGRPEPVRADAGRSEGRAPAADRATTGIAVPARPSAAPARAPDAERAPTTPTVVAPEVKSKPMAASAPPVAPEVRSKPIAASAPAVAPEVKSKPVAPAPPASKATAAIQPPPAKSGVPSSTTALAGMFPALHLQALVYSDVPAQRMVFINGRKYVEGQEVDAGLVLDEITEQGALLSYRGRRYLLREDRDQN